MKTFSVGECIRYGWETFKKRPWFFIGIYLLTGILTSNFRLQLPADQMQQIEISAPLIFLGVVVGLLWGAVNILARMGQIAFTLKAEQNASDAVFKDVWAPHPFWRFIGASIVQGLAAGGPVVAVILTWIVTALPRFAPGQQFQFTSSDSLFLILGIAAFLWAIYAGIRLSFTLFIVMDKKSMPIDAAKASWRLTDGNFWKLFLFSLACIGILILGALCLLVGLLVAFPVVMLATVHLYRTLAAKTA